MRHLLRVLIQTLARFFQGCADVLGALGRAAGPAVGELPAAAVFSGRPVGPPEDWSRRTSPPPPAHWVELVKARAPGFLGQETRTPDPRPRLLRPLPELPRAGKPPREASESGRLPATHVPAPDAVLPERTGFVGAPLPPPSARGSELPRVKSPRTVRIVTRIEEHPRRPAAGVPPESSAPGDPGTRESILREKPGRIPPSWETPRTCVPPLREEVPPSEIRPETGPSFLETFQAVQDGKVRRPRPGGGSEPPAGSTRAGFAVIPALKISRPKSRRPLPEIIEEFPSDPAKREQREALSSPGEAAFWPDLPASAEREDLDDARMLCRELRRQALLEDEQRGIPWSA